MVLAFLEPAKQVIVSKQIDYQVGSLYRYQNLSGEQVININMTWVTTTGYACWQVIK